MRLILFVVGIKLLVTRHYAAVERMRFLARHLDHDGLVHAAGNHLSHYFLTPALHLLGRRRVRFYRFRHYLFSVAAVERCRSPMMVFTRAISRRSPRIFFRLSVWPMLSWNFSLKS